MRSVILGTDWWTDCDDAVAVRLLANAHRKKEIQLLGVAMSGCMEHSVRSLDAFLRDSGVSVPIGIDLAGDDFGGNPPYQKRLSLLPSGYEDNSAAEDPVGLYRRLIAESERPIELIEIGYPQILAALLQSEGGVALIREKVSHLWIMAGKWDEPDGGRENNFARNRRASEAAAVLCRMWPGRITFLGWEVGASVISGSHLPESDVLKQALNDHGSPGGRSSWDPMLILLAVAGDPEKAGYRCVNGRASVDPETGRNFFCESPDGLHRYVVKTRPDSFYAEAIDRRLTRRG